MQAAAQHTLLINYIAPGNMGSVNEKMAATRLRPDSGDGPTPLNRCQDVLNPIWSSTPGMDKAEPFGGWRHDCWLAVRGLGAPLCLAVWSESHLLMRKIRSGEYDRRRGPKRKKGSCSGIGYHLDQL